MLEVLGHHRQNLLVAAGQRQQARLLGRHPAQLRVIAGLKRHRLHIARLHHGHMLGHSEVGKRVPHSADEVGVAHRYLQPHALLDNAGHLAGQAGPEQRQPHLRRYRVRHFVTDEFP